MAAIAVLGLTLPAAAQDRALAAVRGELDALETTLMSLSKDVATPELYDKPGRFARRLNDAQVLVLLNDPTRASLILYDAVEDPEAKSYPNYDDAVFYLGESLFMMRHDSAARLRFLELQRRNNPAYTGIALQRLIQIADRNNRYDGLDALVASMRAKGPLPSEVAYIWTKSQVLRGNADLAKREAAGVPRESRLWAKTRYMAAVAEVQLGRYAEARAIFEELAVIADNYEEAPAIRDLAAMDRARIFLDQGDLPASVDAYQQIDRKSRYFEQSLYEASWSYVRAADLAPDDAAKVVEYKKAQRTLEILMLSESETELMCEARLLYGNILIRVAAFDQASIAFDDLARRYRSAGGELAGLLAAKGEPHQYYEEVVVRPRMGDSKLSPLAMSWTREDKSLQSALRVSDDLDQSDGWLRESLQLVADLLAVLDSNRRSSFFPQIRDKQARAFELEDQLIGANTRLLAVQREITQDALDGDAKREVESILQELARLDPEYRALPKRRDEVESRIESRKRVMDEKGRDVFRIGFELESMRSTVRGLNQWYAANAKTLSREERDSVRERIDKQTADLDGLEKTQKDLVRDVATARQLVALSAREARELQVRERYEQLLGRQRELLDRAAPRLDAGGRALNEQAGIQRERMSRFVAELRNITARIDAEMDERAEGLRSQVLREKVVLAELAERSRGTRRDAEETVGEVARAAVYGASSKFHDIVLRADVGGIDVAWQLKEQRTAEINRRVTEQRRELEVLDAEFREVLAE